MKKLSDRENTTDAERQAIVDMGYEYYKRNHVPMSEKWHMDVSDIRTKALELALGVYALYTHEERSKIRDELKTAGEDPVTGFLTINAQKFERYIMGLPTIAEIQSIKEAGGKKA